MKSNIFYLACFILLVVSCNTSKPDLNKMVNDFADLECRAILLREQRFALANQIRFTEDTLLQTKNAADTVRLRSNLATFAGQRETLTQHSLALSDTIRIVLDSLMQKHLPEKDDKEKFNEMLNSTLKDRGCVEKS